MEKTLKKGLFFCPRLGYIPTTFYEWTNLVFDRSLFDDWGSGLFLPQPGSGQ